MRVAAYPGDRAVRAWASASPYRFLVYPIAGTHATSTVETWHARAPFLRSLGWGLAVVYAPRVSGASDGPSGSRGALTRSLGAADGYDAVVQWRWEHMPAGATCYLDTTVLCSGQSSTSPPMGWLDYYKGWVGAVLDSGIVHAGTCCAATHVPELAEALRAVYRERRREPRRPSFWTVSTDSALPSLRRGADDQARWQAEIWQSDEGAIRKSYGGVPLMVSPCWAASPDPSFDASPDRSAIDPASLTAVLRPGAAAGVSTAIPSLVVADARALLETCLGALALANTGGASPFPRGIDDVEINLTERDGAAHAQIRVSGSRLSGAEHVK